MSGREHVARRECCFLECRKILACSASLSFIWDYSQQSVKWNLKVIQIQRHFLDPEWQSIGVNRLGREASQKMTSLFKKKK